MRPRFWHIVLCSIVGSGIFVFTDFAYIENLGGLPKLTEIWWLAALVPALCGAVVTLGAGGAPMWKRVIGAVACGGGIGVLYTAGFALLGYGGPISVSDIIIDCVWRVFVFIILSTIGMLLTEIKLPEPNAV
jgi:hypothetical protein